MNRLNRHSGDYCMRAYSSGWRLTHMTSHQYVYLCVSLLLLVCSVCVIGVHCHSKHIRPFRLNVQYVNFVIIVYSDDSNGFRVYIRRGLIVVARLFNWISTIRRCCDGACVLLSPRHTMNGKAQPRNSTFSVLHRHGVNDNGLRMIEIV